ncbi:MAG: alkyl hydroperoxide reductase, partial [Pseudomonadota bacterium]
MQINQLKREIPDFAKDLRINLGNVLDVDQSEGLTDKQVWLTALATAVACKNVELIDAVASDAASVLDAKELDAARAAAAIMGMNNVYYRFLHLTSNEDYKKLPAKLRMSVIGNPGIDKVDFELVSLAVSAI